jgi:hypothetical protein
VAGDLVFIDPPYLYGNDQVDQQSYNVDRFGVADVRFLAQEIRRLVDLGAHVIFCWGERSDALVPDGGSWLELGRDYVWLSESLTLPIKMAQLEGCGQRVGGWLKERSNSYGSLS